MNLPSTSPNAKPSVVAAVLLLARELLAGRPWPETADDILAVTGAGHSQAYTMLRRLREVTVTLAMSAGRPPAQACDDASRAVLTAVRDFLMEHPGAVAGRGPRRRYSEELRRFVVGLTAPDGVGRTLTVEQLADTSGVPLGTLKDWLRAPVVTVAASFSTDRERRADLIDALARAVARAAEAR